MSLIRCDESVLLVIDAQEGFYGEERLDVDRAAFELCLTRATWVAALALALGVPAVVTEEDPEHNGPTSPRILERLPAATPVLTKPVFAAGDNPPVLAALEATGRRSVVAVGLETDVCVAHSAISLHERGYHVAAVTDALFSPGEAHRHGLDRLRSEGVQLLSAKELFYDWTRALADVRALIASNPELDSPPGFRL